MTNQSTAPTTLQDVCPMMSISGHTMCSDGTCVHCGGYDPEWDDSRQSDQQD
jgi:hypothetical protein